MQMWLLVLVATCCYCTSRLDAIPHDNLSDASFDFPPLNVAEGLSTSNVWRIPSYSPNIRALSTARNPFVLSNHSTRSWKATGWNFQTLHQSGRWSNLFGVVSLQSPARAECGGGHDGLSFSREDPSIFVSAEESGEGSTIRHSPPGSSASAFQIINQMTMLAFLLNFSRSDTAELSAGGTIPDTALKSRRLLYSTEFDNLEKELQLHDDTEWSKLLIDESHCNASVPCSEFTSGAKAAAPEDHPSPLLHLLHPGVALQARYSEYHTVRVQLQGRGRYYLFPPQHTSHPLHVFPSVHQHAGQAQVNVYHEGGAVANDTCTIRPPRLFAEYARQLREMGGRRVDTEMPVRVAELQSGEVLYVPPFWSVHTEALTFSVLLDVLSVSLEQQTLAPAIFLSLPFAPEMTRTKEQRVVAAQVYLVHVLSRVHGVTSVRKIAHALYQTRYSGLYPENGLFLRKSKFTCLRNQPDLYDSLVAKLSKEKIAAAAVFVAARLNSPFFAQGRPQHAAKWTWLAGYIEKLARWAMMGDGDQAVLFIRECLHMDRVLSVVEEVQGPGIVVMDPTEEL